MLHGTEFWKFLVGGGVLDANLTREFNEKLALAWLPLGQILIQRGVMTSRQVQKLLRLQAKEPNERLGDIATREGMCLEEDIQEALTEQSLQCPQPVEQMIGCATLEDGSMITPLIEYHRFLEGRVHSLRTVVPKPGQSTERMLDGNPGFWEFLVEVETLTEELVREIQQDIHEKWMPLGKILIRNGTLEMSQVMGLLNMQVEEPELRLGDLALREGMCKEGDLRKALLQQRNECAHPVDMLLADERVDNGRLLSPWMAYLQSLEARILKTRAAQAA